MTREMPKALMVVSQSQSPVAPRPKFRLLSTERPKFLLSTERPKFLLSTERPKFRLLSTERPKGWVREGALISGTSHALSIQLPELFNACKTADLSCSGAFGG